MEPNGAEWSSLSSETRKVRVIYFFSESCLYSDSFECYASKITKRNARAHVEDIGGGVEFFSGFVVLFRHNAIHLLLWKCQQFTSVTSQLSAAGARFGPNRTSPVDSAQLGLWYICCTSAASEPCLSPPSARVYVQIIDSRSPI